MKAQSATPTTPSIAWEGTSTMTFDGVTEHRPFQSLVKVNDEWTFARIGELQRTRAAGIRGQEIRFVADSNGKEYELGTYRSGTINDHRPVYSPLLDAGWEVERHETLRGGAFACTTFSHPDQVIEDPLGWDLDIHKGTSREMKPSLLYFSDPRKGHMMTLTAGLFRMVCTNGLIAKVLDLGELKLSHDMPAQALMEKTQEFSAELLTTQPWEKLALEAYPKTSLATVMAWTSHKPAELPRVMRPAMVSFQTALTPASRQGILEQFALILETDTVETVTLLDIINAITNVNQGLRTYAAMGALSASLGELVELAAWR